MEVKDNAAVNEGPDEENKEELRSGSPSDSKDVKISELETKLEELNDRYLRLFSEFDNYKKRSARERAELIRTAGEDILRGMLPVMDDLERAIRSNEGVTDINAINDGFQLIRQKMKSFLSGKGIEAMESKGKEFNPDVHEAITNVPAPGEEMKGKVVEEIEKGYCLNGKVIRFAKVVVGS